MGISDDPGAVHCGPLGVSLFSVTGAFAAWTSTAPISSIEYYPGDGTSSRPPAMVIFTSGIFLATPIVTEAQKRMVDLVEKARTQGSSVSFRYPDGGAPVYYYYHNGSTWVTIRVDRLANAVKLL